MLEHVQLAVGCGGGNLTGLVDGQKRIELADGDENGDRERRDELGRVGAVADRLDRGDKTVLVLLEGNRPGALHGIDGSGVREQLRCHVSPDSGGAARAHELDRSCAGGPAFRRIGVDAGAGEDEPGEALRCTTRDRERAVAAHRGSTGDERIVNPV